MDKSTSGSAKRKRSHASKVTRSLYLDQQTADIRFIFDDGRKISAHKCILVKSSVVFKSMFYGELAGKGDVSLPGKKSEAFENFLQFCYIDAVEINLDNITDMMSLVHECQMFDSLKFCGQFWADNLIVDDICSAYAWAIQLEMFESFCEGKIAVHSDEVFETAGFLSCPYNVLDRIWDIDLCCDESTLLGACLNWSRHACNQNDKNSNDFANVRGYLKGSNGNNLLHKIRYEFMALNDLMKYMDANDNLFDDCAEVGDVFRLVNRTGSLQTNKFKMEPRKASTFVWNEDKVLTRNVMPVFGQINSV